VVARPSTHALCSFEGKKGDPSHMCSEQSMDGQGAGGSPADTRYRSPLQPPPPPVKRRRAPYHSYDPTGRARLRADKEAGPELPQSTLLSPGRRSGATAHSCALGWYRPSVLLSWCPQGRTLP
jgi:hypothetical protein